MPFKFTKVVDITFISKDSGKTSEFYEMIGLPKIDVPELAVFVLGDKELAIHPELPDDCPVENPNTVYVSVFVDKLKELCNHLDAFGVSYFGPKDSHPGTPSIHITDPDGNHLEIHQETRRGKGC